MSDRVGEQFGDYRLTRKLGGGTFGDVYLGQHTGNKTRQPPSKYCRCA